MHCLTLQSLVHHQMPNLSAIHQTKDLIIYLMLQYIANGNVPEIANARYNHMRQIDLVFEALCLTLFDAIFKTSTPKHQHATRKFIDVLLPFYLAGVLQFSHDYYIRRFRVRRYSYRHRQHRYEMLRDFETAHILLQLSSMEGKPTQV